MHGHLARLSLYHMYMHIIRSHTIQIQVKIKQGGS